MFNYSQLDPNISKTHFNFNYYSLAKVKSFSSINYSQLNPIGNKNFLAFLATFKNLSSSKSSQILEAHLLIILISPPFQFFFFKKKT